MLLLRLLFLCFYGTTIRGTETLVFTHLLYRHGARSPSRTYPKDPYQMEWWPQGADQLTQEGMREQMALGDYLRQRYVLSLNLLSPNYTRKEIYVRSTNIDRALQSAGANLAGLYPPNESQTFSPSLPWQPIPIHCDTPDDQDLLLKPSEVSCPSYDKIYRRYYDQYFTQYNKHNKLFYAYFKNQTGVKGQVDARAVARYGYAGISCEIAQNLSLPSWVMSRWNASYPTSWSVIKEMKRVYRTKQFDRPDLAKLRGGYLLGDIVKRTKERASPLSTQEPTKMVMYSSHDSTVFSLMYAMGVENSELVPFASCVMVELYKRDNSYTVKLLYRNESSSDPFLLHVPGCSSPSCPLEEFVRLMKPKMYSSEAEALRACQLPPHTHFPLSGVIIVSVLSVLLTAVILSVVFLLIHKKGRKSYGNI